MDARPTKPESPPTGDAALERHLCLVGGTNVNYASSSGTAYHIQIEDRGPVHDRVTETDVRRVNVIIYANYGEPNARIVHGRDHDFPDLRSAEHNQHIKQKIQELAGEAREIIERKEAAGVERIKAALRRYYLTKDESAKQEFEAANIVFPFLFSKAWAELKQERGRPAATPAPAPEPMAAAPEVLYPLDADLRERVIEIERMILDMEADLGKLKGQGGADDILVQTCRKMVARTRESLSGGEPSEFSTRRLDMTLGSLLKTWRQVKSRLRSSS